MTIPKPIERLTNAFHALPGIGSKTAQRLTFYLLHVPQEQLDQFANSLSRLKQDTQVCQDCFNISETTICWVCNNAQRDSSRICIVEQPLDIYAIEKSHAYTGLYHVLHGCINPLDNVGPHDLHLHDIIPRIGNGSKKNPHIKEIIIATNPTMEGEATAMYLEQLIHKHYALVEVTRLGRGLPTGSDIEYADEITLSRAFEGRREMH